MWVRVLPSLSKWQIDRRMRQIEELDNPEKRKRQTRISHDMRQEAKVRVN
jgi:hypothetical protein